MKGCSSRSGADQAHCSAGCKHGGNRGTGRQAQVYYIGKALLRIPDPGSNFFPSRIPVPNCLHPGSRIRIKEFKYFNPKKPKKCLISFRKYDPGCSSRIPDPDADFLPIPDPGSRGQKGTGSRIRIRNTGHHSDADPQHLPCSFGLGCSD